MTVKRIFGTDGVRGGVTSINLLPENIVRVGRILGILAKHRANFLSLKDASVTAITIGRDTRASGTYLEHALIAGITAVGVDVICVGIMPTAAVAFCTKSFQTPLGIMISASHNPFYDNGLKLFDAHGFKIAESVELAIEQQYFSDADFCEEISLTPGKVSIKNNAYQDYSAMITSSFPTGFSLTGLKIVVDCAHGAAASIAERIFSEKGAEAIFIGSTPDGSNINRGFGSEFPDQLKKEVVLKNAHLGIAFDGDADRVIFVDEKGQLIDGDAILAAIAIDLKKCGALKNNTVVSTIMSSVALDLALAQAGVDVVRTQVGDKYVVRKMMEHDYCFGGENSGHLILYPHTTTGDGIFSALKFLSIVHEASKPASEFMSFFKPTPKLLKNIDVREKIPLVHMPITQAAIARANHDLQSEGRVMLRYSGTENKARLLVEASTDSVCKKIADEIAHAFRAEIEAKI